MAKLTRKSYKRKKIAFAAVILGGVALVSSGFAAWVLSQDKTANGGGAFTVGKVEDGSLEMEITSEILQKEMESNTVKDKWVPGNPNDGSDKFVFDSEFNDKEGRVKYKVGTDEYEQLSIRYTAKITSDTDSFDKLTINMDSNTWVDQHVTNTEIVAPECYKNDLTIGGTGTDVAENLRVSSEKDSSANKNVWTIQATVSFKWGEKFDGLNPSVYYDKDYTGTSGYDYVKPTKENGNKESGTPKGADIKYADMKTVLDGLFAEDIPPFTITFVAHAK